MATPMSACFSAGASLTPSPVMATNSLRSWRAMTILSFCSGDTRAYTRIYREERVHYFELAQEEILKKWAKDNNIDPALVKRRTPVEIAYDTLIYYGANKESLLEGKYDWSGVQSSDGYFVYVGVFGSVGLIVLGRYP